jgi:type IV secretory pathway TrbD component
MGVYDSYHSLAHNFVFFCIKKEGRALAANSLRLHMEQRKKHTLIGSTQTIVMCNNLVATLVIAMLNYFTKDYP